jgi:hypothetical protein
MLIKRTTYFGFKFDFFFRLPGLTYVDNALSILQFLSSQNPDTFASVDDSYYYGPILCDEEEISAKMEHCLPGYIESGSSCFKVLEEKMTKDAGEVACGVNSDYGVLELGGDYFTQRFIGVYTSGNILFQ